MCKQVLLSISAMFWLYQICPLKCSVMFGKLWPTVCCVLYSNSSGEIPAQLNWYMPASSYWFPCQCYFCWLWYIVHKPLRKNLLMFVLRFQFLTAFLFTADLMSSTLKSCLCVLMCVYTNCSMPINLITILIFSVQDVHETWQKSTTAYLYFRISP